MERDFLAEARALIARAAACTDTEERAAWTARASCAVTRAEQAIGVVRLLVEASEAELRRVKR